MITILPPTNPVDVAEAPPQVAPPRANLADHSLPPDQANGERRVGFKSELLGATACVFFRKKTAEGVHRLWRFWSWWHNSEELAMSSPQTLR